MRYKGGCHCGAVRYEVEMELDKVIACNCSYCGKRGHLMAFAAEADFTLLSGADALTDYQFNRKVIHHPFCRTCGLQSFGRGTRPDGTSQVMINVRCLDDVEPGDLPVIAFDGKNKL